MDVLRIVTDTSRRVREMVLVDRRFCDRVKEELPRSTCPDEMEKPGGMAGPPEPVEGATTSSQFTTRWSPRCRCGFITPCDLADRHKRHLRMPGALRAF